MIADGEEEGEEEGGEEKAGKGDEMDELLKYSTRVVT